MPQLSVQPLLICSCSSFSLVERSIVRVADECMYYLLVERETSAFLLVDLCNVLSTGDVERWIFQHDGWRRKFCKLEA